MSATPAKTTAAKGKAPGKQARKIDAAGNVVVEFHALALCPYAEIAGQRGPGDAEAIVSVGAAGVVTQIENTRATDLRVGDEVWTRFAITDLKAITRVAIPARYTFAVPLGISLAQAATLGDSGLMALAALLEGNVGRGQRVLIHGAANPFGSAAIALATHLGAEAIATVDSSAELGVAESAGAKHVAVAGKRDTAPLLNSWAAKGGAARGFDVIFDPALAEHMQINNLLLAQNGVILTCALMGRTGFVRGLELLAAKNAQVRFLSKTALEKYDLAAMAALINEAVTAGRYRPLVGQVLAPGELDGALARLARGRVVGNLVFEPAPPSKRFAV
jgi:NADPH:quinone reductase-like Zn-dependent oxidoreductase